ncbi:hypothetical protein NIES4071_61030 [Calothrix sp. NIES-4071]|nr:hypothetical protein NIES4071_61030 [Calothrix sp. NIES-4071]BAZ60410.1 hypothetical protein NIES4105_60980 [Calothrix sp. NIES-4105]
MSRIAILGIMILPAFLWHVSRSVAGGTPVSNLGVPKTAIATYLNSKLESTSYLIAARDEKIQDCIRLGNCKD